MKQNKNEVPPGTLILRTLNLITGAYRKQLAAVEGKWRQISEIMSRTIDPSGGSL